jgi:hypothetical protein
MHTYAQNLNNDTTRSGGTALDDRWDLAFVDDWREASALWGDHLLKALVSMNFSGLNEQGRQFFAHEWCVLFHSSRAMRNALRDIEALESDNTTSKTISKTSEYVFESARILFVWLAHKGIHPLEMSEATMTEFFRSVYAINLPQSTTQRLVDLVEFSAVCQFLGDLGSSSAKSSAKGFTTQTVMEILDGRFQGAPDLRPSGNTQVKTSPSSVGRRLCVSSQSVEADEPAIHANWFDFTPLDVASSATASSFAPPT